MADRPQEKLKETPPNQPFFILRWVDVSWFYFHALSKLVFASFTTSKLGNYFLTACDKKVEIFQKLV